MYLLAEEIIMVFWYIAGANIFSVGWDAMAEWLMHFTIDSGCEYETCSRYVLREKSGQSNYEYID